jgi:hypothetical protein
MYSFASISLIVLDKKALGNFDQSGGHVEYIIVANK